VERRPAAADARRWTLEQDARLTTLDARRAAHVHNARRTTLNGRRTSTARGNPPAIPWFAAWLAGVISEMRLTG
jgi:hypothetical protein